MMLRDSLLALCAAACLAIYGCAPNRFLSKSHLAAVNDVVYSNGVVVTADVGSAIDTGYGTIAYDLRATPGQIVAGTDYVLRYMRHWFPIAPHGLTVRIVQDGSLVVNGAPNRGARNPDTGEVWLTYSPVDATTPNAYGDLERSGEVFASEWEIPLCAQGVLDPPTWTWGASGPLFPGQSTTAAELSAQSP